MEEIYYSIDYGDIPKRFEDDINEKLSNGMFIKKDGLKIDKDEYLDDDKLNEILGGESNILVELVEKPKTIIISENDEFEFNAKVDTLITTGWEKGKYYYNESDNVHNQELYFDRNEFYPYKKVRVVLHTEMSKYEHPKFPSNIDYYNYKNENVESIGYKPIDDLTIEGNYCRDDGMGGEDYIFWKIIMFYWDYNDESLIDKIIEKNHYSEGQLSSSKYYMNGEKHGTWTEYDSDGQINDKCEYEEGVQVGLHEKYYKGKLVLRENYKKGLLNGQYFNDYIDVPEGSTGGEKAEGQYKDGKEYGEWHLYTSPPIAEHIIINYKDGKLDGSYKVFYRDQISIEGFYQEGNKEGKWTYFNEDGTIWKIKKYGSDGLLY